MDRPPLIPVNKAITVTQNHKMKHFCLHYVSSSPMAASCMPHSSLKQIISVHLKYFYFYFFKQKKIIFLEILLKQISVV